MRQLRICHTQIETGQTNNTKINRTNEQTYRIYQRTFLCIKSSLCAIIQHNIHIYRLRTDTFESIWNLSTFFISIVKWNTNRNKKKNLYESTLVSQWARNVWKLKTFLSISIFEHTLPRCAHRKRVGERI